MPDNLGISVGADATVRTKDNAGIHLNLAAIADATGVNIAAVSAAGLVSVDGSGATQPVSGTVTANLAAGTNNIGDVDVLSVVPGTGATNLGKAEDAVHASGDTGVMMLGVRNDNGLTAFNITNGDYTPLAVDQFGFVQTNLWGLTQHDGAVVADRNYPTVIGGGASAAAPAAVSADGDAVRAWFLRNGAQATVLTAAGALIGGDAANGLDVDVTRLPALAAGTAAIGTVNAVDGSSRTLVVGPVAADSPVGSSSPVQVGVEARTTDGTPISAAGDLVRPIADTLGKQVVLQGAVHDRQVNGKGTFTTTTAADVIAAGGVGVRIVVTSIAVTNAHATTGTKVEIRDGTTVKVQLFAAAAGGGWAQTAGGPPLFISTANTAVTARCVTTGADVDVFVSGYTIAN